MGTLIEVPRSVIPACDVDSLSKLKEIVEGTFNLPGIGGYKIGAELGLTFGIGRVTSTIRAIDSGKPIIYDHQKGATDIPEFGPKFAKVLKSGGVDAAILFPFGGRVTEEAWIKACQDQGLVVLVGGEMTQAGFLASDGGFVKDTAPAEIYELAMELGVTDFVVPGNKPDSVLRYHSFFTEVLGAGRFTLYAPGFISQGGDISETGKVAGDNWHAIVGSALYTLEGTSAIREAATRLTAQIAA